MDLESEQRAFERKWCLGWGLEQQPIAIDDDIPPGSFGFEYVNENVPSCLKLQDLDTDERFFQLEGCSCSTTAYSCSEGSCTCMERFGSPYDADGSLTNVDPYEAYIRPLFECNSNCACGQSCASRIVQNGVTHKLKVFRTKKKGYGVKTLESIIKNSFVCQYAGEILTSEEAQQRTSALLPMNTNFVMTINEQFASRREQTFIDPTYKGNIGRLINHSCDPNLFLVPVRVDDMWPHVALFALRHIDAGEELTYDYSGDLSYSVDSSEITSNEPLVTRFLCYCESPKCKKYLPMDSSLFYPGT